MALYYNGDNVSSINFTPQMTLAEYNALSVKPKYWIRTDADELTGIPADEISFDNTDTSFTGTDVQEVLEEVDASIDIVETALNNLDAKHVYKGETTSISVQNTKVTAAEFTFTGAKGRYLVFGSLNATWDYTSFQFFIDINLDNTVQCGYSSAMSQSNAPCNFSGVIDTSVEGTHTLKIECYTGGAAKTVQINSYQQIHVNIIRIK